MGLRNRLQADTAPVKEAVDAHVESPPVVIPKRVIPKKKKSALDAQHDYFELKENIHRRLIDRIDLTKLETLPKQVLTAQVKEVIEAFLEEEPDIGPTFKRDQLTEEILNETFGLGPLEPLINDPTVSDILVNSHGQTYVERFGKTKDEVFVTAPELRKTLGDEEFEKLPTGAIGLYTYYERLAQGLRQLMSGARKFDLSYMSRDDVAALTEDAARISGIKYIKDVDEMEAQEILDA